jgi:hypothetical protein
VACFFCIAIDLFGLPLFWPKASQALIPGFGVQNLILIVIQSYCSLSFFVQIIMSMDIEAVSDRVFPSDFKSLPISEEETMLGQMKLFRQDFKYVAKRMLDDSESQIALLQDIRNNGRDSIHDSAFLERQGSARWAQRVKMHEHVMGAMGKKGASTVQFDPNRTITAMERQAERDGKEKAARKKYAHEYYLARKKQKLEGTAGPPEHVLDDLEAEDLPFYGPYVLEEVD